MGLLAEYIPTNNAMKSIMQFYMTMISIAFSVIIECSLNEGLLHFNIINNLYILVRVL